MFLPQRFRCIGNTSVLTENPITEKRVTFKILVMLIHSIVVGRKIITSNFRTDPKSIIKKYSEKDHNHPIGSLTSHIRIIKQFFVQVMVSLQTLRK